MTMESQDFTMWSGDTKVLSFTVTNAAGGVADLSGWTIRWRMARGSPEKFSSTATISKTSLPGGGISVTSEFDGLFEIRIEADETAPLRGTYYHECDMIDGFGNVATLATGTITIKRDLITS